MEPGEELRPTFVSVALNFPFEYSTNPFSIASIKRVAKVSVDTIASISDRVTTLGCSAILFACGSLQEIISDYYTDNNLPFNLLLSRFGCLSFVWRQPRPSLLPPLHHRTQFIISVDASHRRHRLFFNVVRPVYLHCRSVDRRSSGKCHIGRIKNKELSRGVLFFTHQNEPTIQTPNNI